MKANISEEQAAGSLKNNENCLLCYNKVTISSHNSVDIFKTCTSLTVTPISETIGHILEAEITKDLTHSDYICESCFKVVDEVDRIETRLTQIRNDLRKTYICTLNILLNISIVTNSETLTLTSVEQVLPSENKIGTQITDNWMPVEDDLLLFNREARNVNTSLSYLGHTNVKRTVDKCKSMQDVSSVTTVTKSMNGITLPLQSKFMNVKQVMEKRTSMEDIPFTTMETQNINTELSLYSDYMNGRQVVDKCTSSADVSLMTTETENVNSLSLNSEYMNVNQVIEKRTSTQNVTSVMTEADDIITAAVKLSLSSEDLIVKQVADKWLPVYDLLDTAKTETVNSTLSFSYVNTNVEQIVDKWISMNDVSSVTAHTENSSNAGLQFSFPLEDTIVNCMSEKWTSINDVTSVTTEMENTSAVKLSVSSENTNIEQVTEKWMSSNAPMNTEENGSQVTMDTLKPDCQSVVNHHSDSFTPLPGNEIYCLENQQPNEMQQNSICDIEDGTNFNTSGNEPQTLLIVSTAGQESNIIGTEIGNISSSSSGSSSAPLESQLNSSPEGSSFKKSKETNFSKRKLMDNIVKIKYRKKILENYFTCLLCVGKNNVINDIGSISGHMKSEHNINVFVCHVCGYYCEKHFEFIQHIHEHAIVSEKTLKCQVCDCAFDNIELFSVHKCIYNPKNSVSMSEPCGAQNHSFSQLDSHNNTHSETSLNGPNVIPRDLSTENQMIDNVITSQTFDCTKCDKSFSNDKVLSQQSKIHCDSAPFTCHICGMLFSHKKEVQSHVKTHTGKNVFQCELCDLIFDHNKSLMSHKRVIHPQNISTECTGHGKNDGQPRKKYQTQKGEYKCLTCGASFTYKHHLKRHNKIHTGEKPFKCEFCERAFICTVDLDTHSFVHSDKKRYECLICAKGFMQKNVLYTHMQTENHLSDMFVVNKPFLGNAKKLIQNMRSVDKNLKITATVKASKSEV